MFYQPVAAEVFAYLFVFSRLGGALLVLPGVGEQYISTRVRLLFALAFTVVLTPVLLDRLPAMPETTSDLFLLISRKYFAAS